jgi:hypothetical protein
MQNIVPISDLTGIALVKPIECALCEKRFPSERSKAEHLEHAHPNWAATMMVAYLRQIPRENG